MWERIIQIPKVKFYKFTMERPGEKNIIKYSRYLYKVNEWCSRRSYSGPDGLALCCYGALFWWFLLCRMRETRH